MKILVLGAAALAITTSLVSAQQYGRPAYSDTWNGGAPLPPIGQTYGYQTQQQTYYVQPQAQIYHSQVQYIQPQVQYIQPQVQYIQPQVQYQHIEVQHHIQDLGPIRPNYYFRGFGSSPNKHFYQGGRYNKFTTYRVKTYR